MSRKRLIGLASALATAAFVVTPAVAQATPHYYVSGVKAAEGKTFPSISWGTLTLGFGQGFEPLTCENAVIGDYTNPTGGGAGEGETDNFATIDCADVECPEESGLEVQVHSEGLPWASILVESGAKELLETKGATVVFGCYVAHTSTLASPSQPTCKGNWNPEAKNGSGSLSQAVSKLNFTGAADKLECSNEGVIYEGITEKQLNTMAYGSPLPTKVLGIETTNTGQGTLEIKSP